MFLCLISGSAGAGELPQGADPAEFPIPGATSVLLGRDLFFDPILSGNRNIACATCHIPTSSSADVTPITLGEGAVGLGAHRNSTGHARRIARNTPALFNLGAHEFVSLMHDGSVEKDPSTRFGVRLPEGQFLERPVTSLLAAQALVPMITPDEMAGLPGSNPIADAVSEGRVNGMDGAWHLIALRVDAIPAYRARFDWLIGKDEPLHVADISNALADFITYQFRATDSAFDEFLRGDDRAMTNHQLHGMSLFYGKAGCANCHAGIFQTDHRYHAIGVPQIGPGKGHGLKDYADHGRAAVTGASENMYQFRTPSLRNVTLTAPYGHSGAISSLEAMIRHHADPLTELAEYVGEVGFDQSAMNDFDEVLAIASAVELRASPLSGREIDALVAFLGALTDTSFASKRLRPPETVPSGLPVESAIPNPS